MFVGTDSLTDTSTVLFFQTMVREYKHIFVETNSETAVKDTGKLLDIYTTKAVIAVLKTA